MEVYEGCSREEIFQYLDELREEGITNMWGATPYIMKEFPMISQERAGRLLVAWIMTFGERHRKRDG